MQHRCARAEQGLTGVVINDARVLPQRGKPLLKASVFFCTSSVGVRTSCCIATQVRRRRTDNKRRTDLNAAVLVRSTKPLLIKEIILSFFYAVAPSVGRRTSCCVATQVRRRGTDSKRRVNLNAAVLVRGTKPLLI